MRRSSSPIRRRCDEHGHGLGLEHWSLARPEIFLAVATALLLLYGVLRGEVATAFVSVATCVAC